MTSHGRSEGPDEKADGREEGYPAGDAMRELDHGVHGGRALEDGSIAEGPVVSAACACTGGADNGSPEDHGDEVGKDSPCKIAQSGGRERLEGRWRYGPMRGERGRVHTPSLEHEAERIEQKR